MVTEFVINGALAVVGAALIGGGIAAIIKGHSTRAYVWGGAAVAAGVAMWLIVLYTTTVTRVVGA